MYGNDSDTTEDDQTLSSIAVTPTRKNVVPAGKPPPNIPTLAAVQPHFVAVPATATKVVAVGAKPQGRQSSGNTTSKPSANQVINLRPTELRDLIGDADESDADTSIDKDTKGVRQAQLQRTELNNSNINESLKNSIFECIHDFTAEQPGDLSVLTGDKVTLLAVRPDGWWRCRNNRGDVGLVPKNVLKQIIPSGQEVKDSLTKPVPSKNNAQSQKQIVKQDKKPPQVAEKVLPAIPEAWQQSTQEPFELIPGIDSKPMYNQTIYNGYIPIPNYPLKKIVRSDHFGYACHLFPRLSKSNLGFHDLYWFWNAELNRIKTRKRKVRVCKMFKVHAIGPPEFNDGLEVNFFLFDTRSSTGRQIVSNIFQATIKLESPYSIALFRNVSHPFILRSNYNLSEVVLRAEVMHHGNLVGYSDIELLSKTGHIIPNGKVAQALHTNNMSSGSIETRLIVQVVDVPSAMVAHVDCLPDVMLCHERKVAVFAAYRNVLAEYMANQWTEHGSTWISDTLLATFPYAAEDDDVMNMFITELEKHKTLSKQNLKGFCYLYEKIVLPLIMTTPMPERPEDKQEVFRKYISSLKKHNNPVEYLSTVKSRPLDPFDYVIDLTSDHALD